MVKCPYCSYEADELNFRPLRKPWKFRFYTVKMLECPRCRNVFNHYHGVSSRGKRVEFVIKVRPRAIKGQR